MSFNDIDDTLVAYFKQMLEEESEQQSPESESLEEQSAVAQTEVSAQNENDQVIGSGNEVSDSQPEALPQENEIENPQEDMTLSASDGASSEVCVADETSVEESSDEKDIAAAEVESEISEDNSEPAPDAIAEAEAATETEETEDMPLDAEESSEEVACESEEISETPVENEESSLQNTAVETDNSPSEAREVGRYNIQGVKIEEGENGQVQIILYSDGSSKKIILLPPISAIAILNFLL